MDKPQTRFDKGTRRERAPAELLDRSPPWSEEAEQGVLGSILMLPEIYDDVAMLVGKDDFYDDAHQRIYGHIAEMVKDGRRIDITLLVERLRNASELELVGGYGYLGTLATSVPNASHATEYAQIVRDKSSVRRLILAGTEILRDAYDGSHEPKHLLSQAEQKIFSILEDQGTGAAQPLNDILLQSLTRIDARLSGKHEDGGISTGFKDLDAMMSGLYPQQLIILAARPSMGKTAFAMNIAEHVSFKQQKPVLFVSLEMAALELVDRLLCSFARVSGHHLRSGTLAKEDQQKLSMKAGELSAAPLFVDDTPSRTMTEISAIARRMKRKGGLSLIIIDYLQLIDPDNPKDQRQEQVSKIARRLKLLARELDVPVICLAQLNRMSEQSKDNKPRLSHLRESGAIEQDADVVMFVHREEYYATNDEDRARVAGQAEIIISKQRSGPVGDVKLTWLRDFTRFEDAALHQHEEFAEYGGGGGF
ncbi:MAG: replicative DNA helicase [Pirellulales bacterium]